MSSIEPTTSVAALRLTIVHGPLFDKSSGRSFKSVADHQKQHRVFVVDDEPLIAKTLDLILTEQGYLVTAFSDSVEALQAIQTDPPDFLIADVVMPQVTGIELAIVIREFHPACTVLLFSGHLSTSSMLDRAKDLGHDFEVLAKPVHPLEMLERVRIGLGLHQSPEGSQTTLQ